MEDRAAPSSHCPHHFFLWSTQFMNHSKPPFFQFHLKCGDLFILKRLNNSSTQNSSCSKVLRWEMEMKQRRGGERRRTNLVENAHEKQNGDKAVNWKYRNQRRSKASVVWILLSIDSRSTRQSGFERRMNNLLFILQTWTDGRHDGTQEGRGFHPPAEGHGRSLGTLVLSAEPTKPRSRQGYRGEPQSRCPLSPALAAFISVYTPTI